MLIRPFRSNDDLLASLKKRRAHFKVEKTGKYFINFTYIYY